MLYERAERSARAEARVVVDRQRAEVLLVERHIHVIGEHLPLNVLIAFQRRHICMELVNLQIVSARSEQRRLCAQGQLSSETGRTRACQSTTAANTDLDLLLIVAWHGCSRHATTVALELAINTHADESEAQTELVEVVSAAQRAQESAMRRGKPCTQGQRT